MRAGAWQLYGLWGSQLAAQEASGVMAATMLQQQSAMQAVSVWELEMEDVMREMVREMEEGRSNL